MTYIDGYRKYSIFSYEVGCPIQFISINQRCKSDRRCLSLTDVFWTSDGGDDGGEER